VFWPFLKLKTRQHMELSNAKKIMVDYVCVENDTLCTSATILILLFFVKLNSCVCLSKISFALDCNFFYTIAHLVRLVSFTNVPQVFRRKCPNHSMFFKELFKNMDVSTTKSNVSFRAFKNLTRLCNPKTHFTLGKETLRCLNLLAV